MKQWMRTGGKPPRLLAAMAGLAVVLAACGADAEGEAGADSDAEETEETDDGAAGDPVAELVEEAREEGSLTLSWSPIVLNGEAAIDDLIDGFRNEYGLEDLDIEWTPGGNMPQTSGQIIEELEAGRDASSDVFVGYGTHMITMMDNDALRQYDNWDIFDHLPSEVMTASGYAISVESHYPGSTYSKERLDSGPETLAELTEPEYDGTVASTSYAANWDYLATHEMWGPDATLEYLEELSEDLAGAVGCGEPERILAGEWDVFTLDCNQGYFYRIVQDGAEEEIGYVLPSDAQMNVPTYAGVPENAGSPASAQLFVAYLLTRDAQDVLFETGGADSIYVDGSQTLTFVDDFIEGGEDAENFKEITVDYLLEHNPENAGEIKGEMVSLLTRE